ncbi:hypothetical protein M8J76_008022 [Diaphorina citri]|nr:hypothetical protein M8J76_008022 [Diaphorina citri]
MKKNAYFGKQEKKEEKEKKKEEEGDRIAFEENVEGYRLRGRPRSRWKDNIDKDVELMGINSGNKRLWREENGQLL